MVLCVVEYCLNLHSPALTSGVLESLGPASDLGQMPWDWDTRMALKSPGTPAVVWAPAFCSGLITAHCWCKWLVFFMWPLVLVLRPLSYPESSVLSWDLCLILRPLSYSCTKLLSECSPRKPSSGLSWFALTCSETRGELLPLTGFCRAISCCLMRSYNFTNSWVFCGSRTSFEPTSQWLPALLL